MATTYMIVFFFFSLTIAEPNGCDSIRIDTDLMLSTNQHFCLQDSNLYMSIKNYFKQQKNSGNDSNRILMDSFMVLHAVPSPFGGLFVYAAGNNCFREIYRFWVYEIDTNNYQIREVKIVRIHTPQCLKHMFRNNSPMEKKHVSNKEMHTADTGKCQ